MIPSADKEALWEYYGGTSEDLCSQNRQGICLFLLE